MEGLGPVELVWEAYWTREHIQQCLCPTISWTCAGEGKSGRKTQTHSIERKCQAREAKCITLGDAVTAV